MRFDAKRKCSRENTCIPPKKSYIWKGRIEFGCFKISVLFKIYIFTRKQNKIKKVKTTRKEVCTYLYFTSWSISANAYPKVFTSIRGISASSGNGRAEIKHLQPRWVKTLSFILVHTVYFEMASIHRVYFIQIIHRFEEGRKNESWGVLGGGARTGSPKRV